MDYAVTQKLFEVSSIESVVTLSGSIVLSILREPVRASGNRERSGIRIGVIGYCTGRIPEALPMEIFLKSFLPAGMARGT